MIPGKDELKWQELTGYAIVHESSTGFGVQGVGSNVTVFEGTRAECRAYVQGYILGNLQGIREMLDKMDGGESGKV